MIKTFKVKGFKNFKDELIFDFTSGNYEYNTDAIQDNLVKDSLIYGDNASGKSNLGLALMDIVSHLTDKHIRREEYDKHYLNLDSDIDIAEFEYTFQFDKDELIYRYKKSSFLRLVEEIVLINGTPVIDSRQKNEREKATLKGTEHLTFDFDTEDLSLVKYIRNNTALNPKTDKNVEVFLLFMDFVNRMLSFDSLDGNRYRGFKTGSESIASAIIETGNLSNYNQFLKDLGIDYNLFEKEVDGEKQIYVKFDSGKEVEFWGIMSKGTRSLTLFFYWYLSFEKEVRFVFMDEFDAYFHNDVSREIIKRLIKIRSLQLVITTHNTTNMSNTLLRPDCYYIIEDNEISNLSNKTDMVIRKTQNLEKMYRTGFFADVKN